MADVHLFDTGQLSPSQLRAIRQLLQDAFESDFSDEDWTHTLGGCHAIVDANDAVLAHAAAIERRIVIGSRPFRAGYIEAVAVTPTHRRRGLGTAVMTALNEVVHTRFELGVLSTGEHQFYERLGWERWRGPSYVRMPDGRLLRTAEEDGGIMILRCAGSRDIDRGASIACDERTGDSW